MQKFALRKPPSWSHGIFFFRKWIWSEIRADPIQEGLDLINVFLGSQCLSPVLGTLSWKLRDLTTITGGGDPRCQMESLGVSHLYLRWQPHCLHSLTQTAPHGDPKDLGHHPEYIRLPWIERSLQRKLLAHEWNGIEVPLEGMPRENAASPLFNHQPSLQ